MSYWRNGADTSRQNMKKQKVVGAVICNGRIHAALVAQAKTKQRPYYPRATGSSADNMNFVSNGDILFTFRGASSRMSALSRTGDKSDNNKIKCISVLNGLGDKDSDNVELMHDLEIVGVAEMGTDNNGGHLFNVIRGGIFTVENNSNETIDVGDWVQAYAPTKLEAEEGGRQRRPDAEGEIKLWYKRFKPEDHAATPKSMYKCLTRGDGTGDYSHDYIEYCDAMVRAEIENSTLAVWTTSENNLASTEAHYKYLNTTSGKKQFINNLFARYQPGKVLARKPDGVAPFAQRLEQMKQESAGLLLVATGLLVNNVHNKVLGKATSSALPGHNFSLQLCSYGKK